MNPLLCACPSFVPFGTTCLYPCFAPRTYAEFGMTSGQCVARRYDDGTAMRVAWRDGAFTSFLPALDEASVEDWIAPALWDPQINGYAGVDFQSDDLGPVQLTHAAMELRRAGCTRFLATLITDDWDRLTRRLQHLKTLRDGSPELCSSIVGWHVEGPFLSAQPGFAGAHRPECMRDPTPAALEQLRSIVGNDLLLVTLAPERAGAIESIRAARDLGILVSLGHTNASRERLEQAAQAGAQGFTHLGNGCPRELDRHDNVLWRVLDGLPLTVSFIPDAIHVSPSLFRLSHRLLAPENIIYTTDAMAAAGAPPGTYPLGPLQLEVGPDQVVRLPGRTNFAGSALRPMEGVRRAAAMLGLSWRAVWGHFSERTAQFLGQPLGLQIGQRADFCLLRESEQANLSRVRTFCAGQECL